MRGLWFNPNIHPLPEYRERLLSLQRLQKLWHIDIEYIDNYGIDLFIENIPDGNADRCLRCYSLRLDETARTARMMNLDGFSTTLLVSPYQKFDAIIQTGIETGRKYAIPFIARDFRTGYRGSIPLSKDLGLYRQKYCGCLYSEAEQKVSPKTHG